jgi:pantoate--beta-alanine ligase
MKEAARLLRAGEAVASGGKLVADAGFALDYFEVRQTETLAPIASANPSAGCRGHRQHPAD